MPLSTARIAQSIDVLLSELRTRLDNDYINLEIVLNKGKATVTSLTDSEVFAVMKSGETAASTSPGSSVILFRKEDFLKVPPSQHVANPIEVQYNSTSSKNQQHHPYLNTLIEDLHLTLQ